MSGLERTRQRPVEQMLGVRQGEVIVNGCVPARRASPPRIACCASTGLELVPVGEGLAELKATVVERGRAPTDPWNWVTIGARAAVARTVGVTFGSISSAGESLSVEWRYWPGRPRLAASLRAPAPWPGPGEPTSLAKRRSSMCQTHLNCVVAAAGSSHRDG